MRMVMRKTFIIMLLLLISSRLFAITPDELVRMSEKGAADRRKVNQQLKLDDLHYKLRMDLLEQSGSIADVTGKSSASSKVESINKQSIKESVFVDGKIETRQQRQATKYSRNQKLEQRPRQNHPQNLRNAQRQAEYYSNPPPIQNAASYTTAKGPSNYVTYSDAVEPDNEKYFGIRRGTWIKAELRRDINNAEPGDVELYLSQAIYGAKHTLPVDTQFFANKGLNTATGRLDMLTTYAITPAGREFVLKARIYDTLKVSGLMGIIDVDDRKVAISGTTVGLSVLGTDILKQVAGSGVVGNALSKGGQSMLNDQQRAFRLETKQQVTIFVAPQAILLRVEETF